MTESTNVASRPGGARLLRFPAVREIIGLKKTAIMDRVRAGEFPQPVHLSARTLAWLEDEIHGWVEEQRAHRDATPPVRRSKTRRRAK